MKDSFEDQYLSSLTISPMKCLQDKMKSLINKKIILQDRLEHLCIHPQPSYNTKREFSKNEFEKWD